MSKTNRSNNTNNKIKKKKKKDTKRDGYISLDDLESSDLGNETENKRLSRRINKGNKKGSSKPKKKTKQSGKPKKSAKSGKTKAKTVSVDPEDSDSQNVGPKRKAKCMYIHIICFIPINLQKILHFI